MSLVTVPKMGLNAKCATSSTYTDTIHPGSGYLVVLEKLPRGGLLRGSSTSGASTTAADQAHFSTVLSSWVNIIKTSGCF